MTDDIICKGDWHLGTACTRCQRCLNTAAPVINGLRASNDSLNEKLKKILTCVPPDGHGFDYSDTFKVACFDKVRRVLHGEG